uniref:Retrovirus-related Pol polyprotein from transposon TNT 1-94 n=1 Tax=Cajanus cajan TaxID=3821 RepID=A0A151UC27_CAJCA|nr:hypothetical protein KK1_021137 [Cajanus cajan]
MFSVYLCTRFQWDLKKYYLKVVKRIFRYLIGSTNLSMFYEKHNNFKLVGFCDLNYVGDKVERKNTCGGCHFLGNYLSYWETISFLGQARRKTP